MFYGLAFFGRVSDLALRQESRYEVPHLQLQATLSEAVLAMRFLRLATGNTGLTRSEAGLAVQAMHDLTVNVLSADPDAQRGTAQWFCMLTVRSQSCYWCDDQFDLAF